jgi:PIN domain nuclease of toxin-antitoxin system
VRLLLDTHLVLWSISQSERLSVLARDLMGNPENRLVFSVVCIWEIAIKRGAQRGDFEAEPATIRSELLEHDYEELPILGEHAIAVTGLPPIHGDPFDRMLVAQAMVERITLLTADPLVARYPGPVRKV